MAVDKRLPAVYVNIEDQSYVSEAIEGGRTAYCCLISNKGPHNQIVELNSRQDLYDLFGKPDFSKFGQGHYFIDQHLKRSGKIYVVRPVILEPIGDMKPEDCCSISNASVRLNDQVEVLHGNFEISERDTKLYPTNPNDVPQVNPKVEFDLSGIDIKEKDLIRFNFNGDEYNLSDTHLDLPLELNNYIIAKMSDPNGDGYTEHPSGVTFKYDTKTKILSLIGTDLPDIISNAELIPYHNFPTLEYYTDNNIQDIQINTENYKNVNIKLNDLTPLELYGSEVNVPLDFTEYDKINHSKQLNGNFILTQNDNKLLLTDPNDIPAKMPYFETQLNGYEIKENDVITFSQYNGVNYTFGSNNPNPGIIITNSILLQMKMQKGYIHPQTGINIHYDVVNSKCIITLPKLTDTMTRVIIYEYQPSDNEIIKGSGSNKCTFTPIKLSNEEACLTYNGAVLSGFKFDLTQYDKANNSVKLNNYFQLTAGENKLRIPSQKDVFATSTIDITKDTNNIIENPDELSELWVFDKTYPFGQLNVSDSTHNFFEQCIKLTNVNRKKLKTTGIQLDNGYVVNWDEQNNKIICTGTGVNSLITLHAIHKNKNDRVIRILKKTAAQIRDYACYAISISQYNWHSRIYTHDKISGIKLDFTNYDKVKNSTPLSGNYELKSNSNKLSLTNPNTVNSSAVLQASIKEKDLLGVSCTGSSDSISGLVITSEIFNQLKSSSGYTKNNITVLYDEPTGELKAYHSNNSVKMNSLGVVQYQPSINGIINPQSNISISSSSSNKFPNNRQPKCSLFTVECDKSYKWIYGTQILKIPVDFTKYDQETATQLKIDSRFYVNPNNPKPILYKNSCLNNVEIKEKDYFCIIDRSLPSSDYNSPRNFCTVSNHSDPLIVTTEILNQLKSENGYTHTPTGIVLKYKEDVKQISFENVGDYSVTHWMYQSDLNPIGYSARFGGAGDYTQYSFYNIPISNIHKLLGIKIKGLYYDKSSKTGTNYDTELNWEFDYDVYKHFIKEGKTTAYTIVSYDSSHYATLNYTSLNGNYTFHLVFHNMNVNTNIPGDRKNSGLFVYTDNFNFIYEKGRFAIPLEVGDCIFNTNDKNTIYRVEDIDSNSGEVTTTPPFPMTTYDIKTDINTTVYFKTRGKTYIETEIDYPTALKMLQNVSNPVTNWFPIENTDSYFGLAYIDNTNTEFGFIIEELLFDKDRISDIEIKIYNDTAFTNSTIVDPVPGLPPGDLSELEVGDYIYSVTNSNINYQIKEIKDNHAIIEPTVATGTNIRGEFKKFTTRGKIDYEFEISYSDYLNSLHAQTSSNRGVLYQLYKDIFDIKNAICITTNWDYSSNYIRSYYVHIFSPITTNQSEIQLETSNLQSIIMRIGDYTAGQQAKPAGDLTQLEVGDYIYSTNSTNNIFKIESLENEFATITPSVPTNLNLLTNTFYKFKSVGKIDWEYTFTPQDATNVLCQSGYRSLPISIGGISNPISVNYTTSYGQKIEVNISSSLGYNVNESSPTLTKYKIIYHVSNTQVPGTPLIPGIPCGNLDDLEVGDYIYPENDNSIIYKIENIENDHAIISPPFGKVDYLGEIKKFNTIGEVDWSYELTLDDCDSLNKNQTLKYKIQQLSDVLQIEYDKTATPIKLKVNTRYDLINSNAYIDSKLINYNFNPIPSSQLIPGTPLIPGMEPGNLSDLDIGDSISLLNDDTIYEVQGVKDGYAIVFPPFPAGQSYKGQFKRFRQLTIDHIKRMISVKNIDTLDEHILWNFYVIGAGKYYNSIYIKGVRNSTYDKMYTDDEGNPEYPYAFMDIAIYRDNGDNTTTLLEGPWTVSLIDRTSQDVVIKDIYTGNQLYLPVVINRKSKIIRVEESRGIDKLTTMNVPVPYAPDTKKRQLLQNLISGKLDAYPDGIRMDGGSDGNMFDSMGRINFNEQIKGILCQAYNGSLKAEDDSIQKLLSIVYPWYLVDYIYCGGWGHEVNYAAKELADLRQDCLLLADTGTYKENHDEEIEARRTDVPWNTWNAALYTNYRRIYDSFTSKYFYISPIYHAIERHLYVDDLYWIAEPVAGIEKGAIEESITLAYGLNETQLADQIDVELNPVIIEADGTYILQQFTTWKRLSIMKRQHVVKFVQYCKKRLPKVLKDILHRKATNYWIGQAQTRVDSFMTPFVDTGESSRYAAVSSYSVQCTFDDESSELTVLLTLKPLRSIEKITVNIIVT